MPPQALFVKIFCVHKKRKVFLSITTTDGKHLEKLKEVNKLGVVEVCVFLTGLGSQKRKDFYKELEKSSIRKIPLVHLRTDMDLEEIGYFVNNFQTEAFNNHSFHHYSLIYDWSKYREKIFLESSIYGYYKEEVEKFGGICIDFAHAEDDRLIRPDFYQKEIEFIEKYHCGCAHLSGIKREAIWEEERDGMTYHDHRFKDLSEFDYLKKYPKEYFPEIIALELENSIKEQLKAKKYIENLLK